MESLLRLFLVVILVFLNGFFVASEFALVAVRRTRIDELVKKKKSTAKLVQHALDNLDAYISATQLGITLASLALGWIGEPAVAHLLEPFFSFLPTHAATFTAHAAAIATAFLLITFLHIVLGELVPKSVALQRAEKTALYVIAPLIFFTKIFKPFIYLLNNTGLLILKLFGLSSPVAHQTLYSEEEVKMIVAQSGKGGIIPQEEVEMVTNVFKLADIPIQQIMMPRIDITAFALDTTLTTVFKEIKRSTYSRFPVYEKSVDTIVGFIHIKDIYHALEKLERNKTIAEAKILRDIINVPETKKADEVLYEMQKKNCHIAVVLDEYGGTAGIVTLEDVIESLIGDILDEFDKPVHSLQKQTNGTYLIDGLMSIEELQEKFHLPVRGQGYTTIGGLIFGILGRTPQISDKVQIGSFVFEVIKLHGRRIQTLRAYTENKRKQRA